MQVRRRAKAGVSTLAQPLPAVHRVAGADNGRAGADVHVLESGGAVREELHDRVEGEEEGRVRAASRCTAVPHLYNGAVGRSEHWRAHRRVKVAGVPRRRVRKVGERTARGLRATEGQPGAGGEREREHQRVTRRRQRRRLQRHDVGDNVHVVDRRESEDDAGVDHLLRTEMDDHRRRKLWASLLVAPARARQHAAGAAARMPAHRHKDCAALASRIEGGQNVDIRLDRQIRDRLSLLQPEGTAGEGSPPEQPGRADVANVDARPGCHGEQVQR
mmetsp:Transcript_41058/g.129467  ORF Transcript_41058/g.129467 Transcript_41058/m.129467 type:complete len:274 (-) Transcript_41058:31-852(-)